MAGPKLFSCLAIETMEWHRNRLQKVEEFHFSFICSHDFISGLLFDDSWNMLLCVSVAWDTDTLSKVPSWREHSKDSCSTCPSLLAERSYLETLIPLQWYFHFIRDSLWEWEALCWWDFSFDFFKLWNLEEWNTLSPLENVMRFSCLQLQQIWQSNFLSSF